MLTRCLKAELLKCRRSPVWIAFLILPIFPAFLGTFNYLGNLGVLQSEWYSLWSQHTLFSACFFMPAQFGVFCAWQWRLEHTGHNWNTAMTAPVPPRDLFLAKWILDVGVAALAQLCIGVLFIVSGLLAGLSLSNLPTLWHWLLFGAIGGVTVCTVQLFLSLVIRSFAIPVAIGLLGGIGGMIMMAEGFALCFPYSLLALGMRANNPQMELPVGSFLLSCAAFILLFSGLAITWLQKRDVAAA